MEAGTSLPLTLFNTQLLYPWFLLLPLAFLVLYFFRPKLQRRSGPRYPSAELLGRLPLSLRQRLRVPALALLSAFTIVLAAVALSRPHLALPRPQQVEARNLMLVLDVSRSMETEDFPSAFGSVARIRAVEAVVSEFIRTRTEDRIGLVVFGSQAYLQSPLTLDHELLAKLVEQLEDVDAGPATAIGDGLGLGIKRISALPGETRAIVLLTDGVSNSGHVHPLKAAKVARDLGIKVHTIGIGSPTSAALGSAGDFDEATLREIADITGGSYFWANSLQSLRQVYAKIDELETTESEENSRRLVEEQYQRWVLGALAAYAALTLLSGTVFRTLE